MDTTGRLWYRSVYLRNVVNSSGLCGRVGPNGKCPCSRPHARPLFIRVGRAWACRCEMCSGRAYKIYAVISFRYIVAFFSLIRHRTLSASADTEITAAAEVTSLPASRSTDDFPSTLVWMTTATAFTRSNECYIPIRGHAANKPIVTTDLTTDDDGLSTARVCVYNMMLLLAYDLSPE